MSESKLSYLKEFHRIYSILIASSGALLVSHWWPSALFLAPPVEDHAASSTETPTVLLANLILAQASESRTEGAEGLESARF